MVILHACPQPTNDLDVDTLRCLEDAIQNFAGSTIIISHDRCAPQQGGCLTSCARAE